MNSAGIQGLRILVVEDEFLLADDARTALARAGAQVVGPVPSVERATRLIEGEAIDAALLDVNLQGGTVFALADALQERRVPFAFLTGYDAAALPSRYAAVSVIEKPVRPEDLVRLVTPTLTARAA